MRWGKVTIIGVGLLGGSIGLALKQRRLVREVHGFARRQVTVRDAVRVGAVDHASLNLLQAVEGADLVVLCTPIAHMEDLVQQTLPALKPGAIVTDVGSVKVPVVRALDSELRRAGAFFVGSHPMAGSEKGGVREARAGLFDKAVCVVTPNAKTDKAAASKVERFWRSLGARVLRMDAALHDKLVSRTSHMPHLVASVLAGMVLDPAQDPRQLKLCATGFRDATRLAAGSPEMWRDITMANRRNLVRDLTRLERELAKLRRMLSDGDAAAVEDALRVACERRAAWKEPSGNPCSSE